MRLICLEIFSVIISEQCVYVYVTCVHMYVCVYVCMYVCVYVCVYICVCMCVCMYVLEVSDCDILRSSRFWNITYNDCGNNQDYKILTIFDENFMEQVMFE